MKTMLKYHSALYLSKTAPADFDFDASAATGYNDNWRKLDGVTFVSEQILDCAGLAMEEQTLYFDGITCQEGGVGNVIQGAAGDSFIVYDIVSSVPLNIDNDYGKIILHGAGYPAGGASNFEHIPYARMTRYTVDLDTQAAFAFKAASEQSGSLEPTASDRLYVYRLVFLYDVSGGATVYGVASGRILFAISTKEEATYQYLMRLKRSYDLQQTPDVD